MCGIAGVVYKKEVPTDLSQRVQNALDSLAPRGPDSQGIWQEGKTVLLHTRLAILAPDKQYEQPLESADNRSILVYNGIAYNHKSLGKHPKSDTANISDFLTSNENDIVDKVGQIDGFFALGWWVKFSQTLWLARDAQGQKPLYYFENEDGFFFASQLKTILALTQNNFEIGAELNGYLSRGYFLQPETVLNKIKKLPAGHTLRYENHKVTVSPYQKAKSKQYSAKNLDLQAILRKAIQKRLISDVPIGFFLSGGLDSSIIAAELRELGQPLPAYSLGFERTPFLDETSNACKTAAYFGHAFRKVVFSNSEIESSFDEYLAVIDEPFADSSSLAFYLLSKVASKDIKVALSGDGADEIFGGYLKHKAFARSLQPKHGDKLFTALANLLPINDDRSGKRSNYLRKAQKFGHLLSVPLEKRFEFLASFSSKSDVESLSVLQSSLGTFPKPTDMQQFLQADQDIVLRNDMLVKVDTMSMAHGLEVRNPFLDPAVVHFANSLPASKKVNVDLGKIILRQSYQKILPEWVLNQPKKGFEIPLSEWIQGIFIERFYAQKAWSNKHLAAFINANSLDHFFELFFVQNQRKHAHLLWSWFIFAQWCQRHQPSISNLDKSISE